MISLLDLKGGVDHLSDKSFFMILAINVKKRDVPSVRTSRNELVA